jgi:hypothetical protein
MWHQSFGNMFGGAHRARLALDRLESRLTPAIADLSVTNSDGFAEVVDGSSFVCTIQVTNHGPEAIANVTIADDFPTVPFAPTTWSAAVSGGATISQTSGAGDILTTANLPVGSTVAFAVTVSTLVRTSGAFTHTATATLAPGDTDPNPINNSATDTTIISQRTVLDNLGVTLFATGSDAGVPGHVKVFDGRSGQLRHSFLPFGPRFLGGVRVATGDVTGDGRDDLVVGTGRELLRMSRCMTVRISAS